MIQRVAHHEPTPLPIGIVGGLGPYAGYDLLRKIFRWTKASTDQEHLPIMLHSFPGWIPERPAYLLGQTKENPGEDIGSIMVQLARNGAKVIGMPCNTAHSPRILNVALERLRSAADDVTFVSIIESAVRHVKTLCPNGGRIGLMGTVATLQTRLYQDALEKAGLEPVLPMTMNALSFSAPSAIRSSGLRPFPILFLRRPDGFFSKPLAVLLKKSGYRLFSLAARKFPLPSRKPPFWKSRSWTPPACSHGN